MMKKTGGRKSRWTVPLSIVEYGFDFAEIFASPDSVMSLTPRIKIVNHTEGNK